MSQNLPPNNNSAQKDNDFEVNFDFLDENTDNAPKKSIGDELDDLSFLNSLDDSTSISAPPPTAPNKQGANDGFDDFLSSLDNEPANEVKPVKNNELDDDPLVASAPTERKPSSKFKDKETAAKPKKSLFSFGKKSDDKKTDNKKTAPAKPKKSLFSFGKKSDDKKAPAKAKKSAFGMDKQADDKSTPAKPKKSTFVFGGKPKDAQPTPTDKSKKPGGSVFGGKPKDAKSTDKAAKAGADKAGKAPTNKKTLWLALGALLAVALLFMAWTMMNSEESAPPPPPAKVAPPKPKTPPPANSATVPAPAGQPAGQAPNGQPAGQAPAAQPVQPAPAGQPTAAGQNAGATANNAQAGANANKNAPLVTGAPAIDTDAIVKAEVPQDPALIKEEIDRLNDKNGQFQEQAKIIDEQLGKLEELTVAKEEKIALLEAQIAQLEAQKKK